MGTMFQKVTVYSDGGARGNPGAAAFGVVVKDENGAIIKEYAEYIGNATNNIAEYLGLIKGLELALEIGAERVDCYLDSELVVKQLKREYKVKNENLQKLFIRAWNLSTKFKKVTYTHIRREFNTEADALLNAVLDDHAK